MRFVLSLIVPFLPFVAGCIAYGGEGGASSGATVRLSWETLVTIYGPMAGMIIWFMLREKSRLEWERKREEKWQGLLENNIETMTLVREMLTMTRIDDEKHRTAIYRLVEEVRDIKAVVTGGSNTRIMTRDRDS